MDNRVYVPDADCIRKTGADYFRSRWIALLAMSAITVFLSAAYALLLESRGLLGSFLQNSSVCMPALILLPLLGFGLNLRSDLLLRLTAYKWEDGNLVRGVIGPVSRCITEQLAAGTVTLNTFGGLVSEADAVSCCSCSGAQLVSLRARMLCNADPEFAACTFDSPQYRKQVFLRPEPIRESRCKVVYRCADGKLLTVPKAYKMSPDSASGTQSSLAARSLSTLAALLLAALLLFSADYFFACHYAHSEAQLQVAYTLNYSNSLR